MIKISEDVIKGMYGCKTKTELKQYLSRDALKYETMTSNWKRKLVYLLASNPASTQHYLWRYVKCLRYCEYYYSNSSVAKTTNLITLYYSLKYIYKISCLRKLSYRLGIQIPPGCFKEGLQIFHYGSIIVNEDARVGVDAIIYAGVLIGAKNNQAPIIGDRCFIGAGSKILGGVHVGNDVTIAPNAVVVHDVPDNAIVAGVPAKIIKYKDNAKTNPNKL